jgi:hypothetical protein
VARIPRAFCEESNMKIKTNIRAGASNRCGGPAVPKLLAAV